MSENSITPIGNVRLDAAPAPLPKVQTSAVVGAQKIEPSEHGKVQAQVESEIEQAGAPSNVSVHFRVNDDTNELTVFVVDRNSHRVLRSIPISEFYKMQAGELLKLAA
ncbi:MAG: flagellar protein FlaG [Chloroflexi bacterium]|nr:flagellar protein FlaG [Chloroflexota bacterium]